MALARLTHSETTRGRVVGSPYHEFWVSDNGVANPITNDSRNVHDWVGIPPGKERLLIGNGKEMRVTGAGSLSLKVHSNTDLNVKSTEVYVAEGIAF